MNEDEMCPNCVTPWKCNGPHLTGVEMEIGNDLGDGTTEVNLELEEALYCTKFGLETILRCHMAGIPTTDLPEMIRLRGEYLSQEPDVINEGTSIEQ